MKTEHARIIPCLDVKDGRLVKGVHFVGLRDVADPAEMAEVYSRSGADELVFLDITATVEGRKTTLEAVARAARRTTIPLTVGGGIREVADVRALLDVGARRVSVNTAAVRRPELIEEVATAFGKEAVVVAVDTRRNPALPSGFEVMVGGGRKETGQDAVEWATEAERLGAGQILPTSMDADGTQAGYDLPMTRAIAGAVSIPVIASGGAGTLEHLYEALTAGGADAVLGASIFHFGTYTVQQAREYLAARGVRLS